MLRHSNLIPMKPQLTVGFLVEIIRLVARAPSVIVSGTNMLVGANVSLTRVITAMKLPPQCEHCGVRVED